MTHIELLLIGLAIMAFAERLKTNIDFSIIKDRLDQLEEQIKNKRR